MLGLQRRFPPLILLSLLLAGGCATLPDNSERVESHAFTDTRDTRLAEARRAEMEAHPGQSGFFLLARGLDAFVARALLADAAERSIDAQYYLLHGDLTGILFIGQLRKAADRGVRVRILTNSLASTDVSVVHAGYAPYRKDLLRAGIELYEINKKLTGEQRKEKKGVTGSSKASLHAKSFVIDRQSVFIGSLNLDPRSVYENTEIGIVLDSREIAGGMAEWSDQNIDRIAFRLELETNEQAGENILWHGLVDDQEQVFTVDPYTSFWRRFGVGFMSILPIESQL